MASKYPGLPANIAARRAEEDRLQAARSVVAETEKVGHFTSFEVRTVGKIQARITRDRIDRGKKEAQDALERRRYQYVLIPWRPLPGHSGVLCLLIVLWLLTSLHTIR